MPCRRGLRLYMQTSRSRTVALDPPVVAAPLSEDRMNSQALLTSNLAVQGNGQGAPSSPGTPSSPGAPASLPAFSAPTPEPPKANILIVDDRADKLLAL